MGIPSYFSLIIRQYKHIVRRWQYVEPLKVTHFYLDCNSIIYDTYHNKPEQEPFTEEWLIQGVIQQIHHYRNMVRPTSTFFVAFDGVAPLAKMEQQRTRRYKGAHFDVQNTSATSDFQLSSITPGTLFMNKLMKEIQKEFLGIPTVMVSTSNEEGEGEHKLFQHIRDHGNPETDVTVVYGLDADLIMLSLFHVEYAKHIFVCREAPAFCKSILERLPKEETVADTTLLFVDISCLHTHIVSHIYNRTNTPPAKQEFGVFPVAEGGRKLTNDVGRSPGSFATVNTPCQVSETRIVHDYIFLCFFLGNDFLPHFPSLNLRTYGMNVLLDTYRKYFLKSKKHLVDVANGQVIWKHVHSLFSWLSKAEHERFLQEHTLRDKVEQQIKNNKKDAGDMNNLPVLYRKEEHYICPKENGWETRYYRALFDDRNGISQVCNNYCEGLEWVFRYYTSNCPDWQWKYRYNYPPLFADLVRCSTVPTSHGHQYFPKSCVFNPFTPIQQLMYVLPASQKHLIPASITDHECRPTNADCQRVVFAYCRYFWECHLK